MLSPLRLLLTLALGLAFIPAADAQNLFQNPGFETGDFTNWTVTGGTISTAAGDFTEGSKGAVLTASAMPTPTAAELKQSFATVATKSYLISFDYSAGAGGGTGSLSVQGTASLNASPLPISTTGFQRISVVVTADSATTTVSISISAAAGIATAKLDNFVAAEAIFSKPGKYTGNLKRTTAIAGSAPGKFISSAYLQTLTCRIDSNGKLVAIVQPYGIVVEGFVLDSKVISLGGLQGTASIVGNNIKLTNSATVAAGSPGNGSSEPIVISDTLVLRKVGN